MLKVLALLAMVTVVSPVWGQRPGGRDGFGRGGMMQTPSFQALDADHDGSISAAEMAGAAGALQALDKNNDGKLTEDEVRPQFGGRGGRGGGRGGDDGPGETAGPSADDLVTTLMGFDKNSDGRLTRDEVPERMQGLFDRADADKNGILTADEIRKSAQTSAPPARGEGRDGREGRGPGGPPSFMRLDPILAAIDTDSNGEISAQELAAAPASLKKLDKDGDGKLSAEEVRLNFGPGRGRGERI